MCGRFTQFLSADDLKELTGLDAPADWTPRYNLSPTQNVLALRAGGGAFEWMRWGLVPGWAKDLKIGEKMINARSETVEEKPSYRQAFLSRRCLLPSTGFYEWKKEAGAKRSVPFFFHLNGELPLFYLAGLWDRWRSPEGPEVISCTILTCAANELVGQVHERMPVMFAPGAALEWLKPADSKTLLDSLKPFPAAAMRATPVSTRVNSPAVEGKICIEEI